MSASIIFQSSRLYARTFMPQQDAPEAFLLYGDEEVTRFLGAAKPSGNSADTADTCIAATEQRLVRYAGAAALDYGLRTLLLPQIFAVVDSANMASRKVVERLGMIYLGQTDRYYGETLELFCNSEAAQSSSLSS